MLLGISIPTLEDRARPTMLPLLEEVNTMGIFSRERNLTNLKYLTVTKATWKMLDKSTYMNWLQFIDAGMAGATW